MKNVVGIDLGGTNLRMYEVTPRGEIPELEGGKESHDFKTRGIKTNKELTSLVLGEIKTRYPHLRQIGISAAGDVDEENLIIKRAANIGIEGHITLGRDLKKEGYTVTLVNDMVAAALGTSMFGQGKKYKHILVATFSTGHGVAKVVNGEVITKAEFGHQPYHPSRKVPSWAQILSCGCGGKNHLEPYVSGKGAQLLLMSYVRAGGKLSSELIEAACESLDKRKRKKRIKQLKHIHPNDAHKLASLVSARDIYQAYQENKRASPQNEIQYIQQAAIADAFGMMISAYNPLEIIDCMGSQTRDWKPLFVPAIETLKSNPQHFYLSSLTLPLIVRNTVRKLGVVGAGAAFYTYNRG